MTSYRALYIYLLLAAVSASWLESRAAYIAGNRSPRQDRAINAGTVHFVADPGSRAIVPAWRHIQLGQISYESSQHPDGFPGAVSIVPDPLGSEGLVYKLTVAPSLGFAAGSGASDRVDLWNNAAPYLGQEGQETWEHFRILFASEGDAYHPAPGNWNWIVQHHNDSRYQAFVKSGMIEPEKPELAWGVDTKARLPNGELATELFMVIRGGDDRRPLTPTQVYAGAPLLRNHWYDMLVHVIWSHEPEKGEVEWWLDGAPVFANRVSTLWQRPDNTIDHVNFEFSNYRVHADWSSTVYFSKVVIGSTRRAVAF